MLGVKLSRGGAAGGVVESSGVDPKLWGGLDGGAGSMVEDGGAEKPVEAGKSGEEDEGISSEIGWIGVCGDAVIFWVGSEAGVAGGCACDNPPPGVEGQLNPEGGLLGSFGLLELGLLGSMGSSLAFSVANLYVCYQELNYVVCCEGRSSDHKVPFGPDPSLLVSKSPNYCMTCSPTTLLILTSLPYASSVKLMDF